MTKEYIGIKCVQAWAQEKDGTPGYAVKYDDGYVSWSPKQAFEKAYLCLGTEREVTEEVVSYVYDEPSNPFNCEDTILMLEFMLEWATSNGAPNASHE